MNSAVEITEETFEENVLNSAQPVLVEFLAPWSRPCQDLDSVVSEIAATLVGKTKVVRINADDSLGLSLWYDIHSVPTLLCFIAGKLRLRIVGTASKEAILSKLKTVGLEVSNACEQPSAQPIRD